MTRRRNLRRLSCAVLFAAALLPARAWAQEDVNSYKVGERVEYKDRSYPESWKEGTVVKVHPEYNQVVVRWDPRPDYPSYTHNGVSIYEQAYNITDVRHIKARAAGKPATDNGGGAAADAGNNDRAGRADRTAADAGGGTGPMTKQEILGYVRTHGYAGGQPKHDLQVCKNLVEQIKRRGVVARIEPGEDSSFINANGCAGALDTDVVEATKFNLGPPTTLNWLTGIWALDVIGGTVDYAPGDGYIHRRNETLGKAGSLTINGGGTYEWRVNSSGPGAKFIRGTWRKATPEEMGLQGGAGIVLQKGQGGYDWIVFKYMDPFLKAERVEVENLQGRGGDRLIGWRR